MSEETDRQAHGAGSEQARLRPGVMIYPLDGESVVFSEETQCLVGLNASATFVFQQLKNGLPASELAQALVSEGMATAEEAERWVTTTLEALRSHGMLAGGQGLGMPLIRTLDNEQEAADLASSMPAFTPFEPVTERSYRLLGTRALVRFGHLAQVRLVDSVIGHLADDSSTAPHVVLDIQAVQLENGHVRSNVYRDGQRFGFAPRLSVLGPVVKSAFWQSTVNAYDFLFYIHAGVVGAGAGCILLPAKAGSGKSSLTAALTNRGFRFFSDEVALIERATFKVPPMSLAICVKATGWDVMARYYPEISTLPTHLRADHKVVRYIPPPLGAAKQPSAPVSHIIFPRYEKHAPAVLSSLSQSEALGRLMAECVAMRHRLDQETAEKIVRWMAGINCYTLSYSSLDDAVRLVESVTPQQ